MLKPIIAPMKQRLYDFPRRGYIKEWEQANCLDHDRLIGAFETGNRESAVQVWQDVHWSFDVQEDYIRRFYFPDARKPVGPEAGRPPSSAQKLRHLPANLRRYSQGKTLKPE